MNFAEEYGTIDDARGLLNEAAGGLLKLEPDGPATKALVQIHGDLEKWNEEYGTSPFDLDAARLYVANVEWIFAKTMPKSPHWYTKRQKRPDLDTEFVEFVRFIRRIGDVRPWPRTAAKPRYHHTYLDLDGWTYWTMGSPIKETILINRCREEDQ